MPTGSGSHRRGHFGGRAGQPSEKAAEGTQPQKATEGPTDGEMPETSLEHFDPHEVDALAMSEPVPAYEFDQRVNW